MLFRFTYEKCYYREDDPQGDTIRGEGFVLIDAATPDEASAKNGTITQTIDPRIEWDDDVADFQDLADRGYCYEDFSFRLVAGPIPVNNPSDFDNETLERHRRLWIDHGP